MKKEQVIIFSDLDGTFLDHNDYTYSEALPAFNKASSINIPISFCSSKSFCEMEPYYEELGISFPFIVENGSAIYIPKGYFKKNYYEDYDLREEDKYDIIELNPPHHEILVKLKEIKKEISFNFKIFTEMEISELQNVTGLSKEKAKKAQQKDYIDSCYISDPNPEKVKELKQAAEEKGLTYLKGGRFHAVTEGADKGKAVKILSKLYGKKFGDILSVAIGDSGNDLDMLLNVDIPYIVKKHDDSYLEVSDSKIKKAPHSGPKGWNFVINKILKNHEK